eukprot:42979-Eustigmatos_ZCMA.PRE.1
MSTSRIVCTSMYADPLHSGHLELLQLSKELAGPNGKLIVIVNTDAQAKLKKGRSFMPQHERLAIISALRYVDEAFLSVDSDKSVCESIRYAHQNYKIDTFSKGGDRFSHEIPEAAICRELGIQIVDGLGAKIQSSSALTGIQEIK